MKSLRRGTSDIQNRLSRLSALSLSPALALLDSSFGVDKDKATELFNHVMSYGRTADEMSSFISLRLMASDRLVNCALMI